MSGEENLLNHIYYLLCKLEITCKFVLIQIPSIDFFVQVNLAYLNLFGLPRFWIWKVKILGGINLENQKPQTGGLGLDVTIDPGRMYYVQDEILGNAQLIDTSETFDSGQTNYDQILINIKRRQRGVFVKGDETQILR